MKRKLTIMIEEDLIPRAKRFARSRGASLSQVWLRFEDGTEGEVNLERSLRGPVFEPLRDVEYFKQVRVDPELGTIVWPNGADIAPETLYARLRMAV